MAEITPIKPTAEQLAVIQSSAEDRLWIEAGAGSGKTEAVARRLGWLLGNGGLQPRQILVLSFSRSAVRALVERLRRLAEMESSLVEDLRHVAVRTFDSWSFRLLRLVGENISELLQHSHDHNIKLALDRLRYRGVDDPLTVDNIGLSSIRHIVTDEVQDLTGLRGDLVLALLDRLAPPEKRGVGFTLLGDSNQAIYGFSANPDVSTMTAPKFRETVQRLWSNELNVMPLSKNHRAHGEAATRAADARNALTSATEGAALEAMCSLVSRLPASDSASLLEDLAESPDDTAILCRDNHQMAGIISDLQFAAFKNNILCPLLSLLSGRPPTVVPAWVGEVLHPVKAIQLTRSQYERIWKALRKDGSSTPTWQLLARASGKSPDVTSIDLGDVRKRISWPDSFPDDENLTRGGVTITTIHQSKGLEFRSVYLVGRGDGFTPENVDDDEEARVLFVGLTRARDQVRRGDMDSKWGFGSFPSRDDANCRWYRKRHNDGRQLEIGCEGDVDPDSIVSPEWLGNEANVKKVQNLLMAKGADVVGQSVVLVKDDVPGDGKKKVYRIDLSKPIDGIVTLGFLTKQFTFQLLDFVEWKKFTLPGKIYNLRVQAISTVARVDELIDSVPEPWKTSRFWLVPMIHGIGQFKLYPKGDGSWEH